MVACILMMVLLMVLVTSLMSLAAIELRRSLHEDQLAVARSNARLALMEAIGQLQKSMGPDRRVSATAELLGDQVLHPQWTGVWRTVPKDGSSWFQRDDLEGGLRDTRWETGYDRGEEVLSWLVSGSPDPEEEITAAKVELVGTGSLGMDTLEKHVEVPLVAVSGVSGKMSGRYGWWTGDLGVRANVSTHDPRYEVKADRTTPGDGGLFRVMASQAPDLTALNGGFDLESDERKRLATDGTATLGTLGKDGMQEHAFDFTVDSQGVLADVAEGGLKRDLTAFFESDGEIPATAEMAGLSDDDSLVGMVSDFDKHRVSSRHQAGGSRFGLLRDWARSAAPFSGNNVAVREPEFDASAAGPSEDLALANELPVKLAGNVKNALRPVLVEASNFNQWSSYPARVIDAPGQPGPIQIYQLRQLMYPRVVLWNPYNVELEMDRILLMLQGNGRQEMWTENVDENQLKPPRRFRSITAWISFEGGRSTDFGPFGFSMNSEGYNDPYMGSYFFAVPKTTFKPGECLVFSPPAAAEYNGLSIYRPGPYDLNANVLSCEVSPDPSRCYYVSGSDLDSSGDGGMDFKPVKFWYAPSGVRTQSDDTRVIAKAVSGSGAVTFDDFDSLPQVSVTSASLQYGAGREARISWNVNERMPMEFLAAVNPTPTVVPNVRTREGIRLRWFHEHPSNIINSGALASTAHFDEALLANWNPRASYAVRSPWENVAGVGGGPWFFGAYTRDLYDQAVSWDEQAPVLRNGRYHGNPFGPPQEGEDRYVLFDLPREETGVISLAQFQHAKLSELIWHPSNAVGNSLADPRLGDVGTAGLNRTAAISGSAGAAALGGFDQSAIGWSSDSQRGSGHGQWASHGRALLGNLPASDNLVYDLSFEVNRTLWDRYFLSTGSTEDKEDFLKNPEADPLPNGRIRLGASIRKKTEVEDIADYHRAAYHLMIDGAFNVNSTRVAAWKALLSSSGRVGYDDSGGTPFPRILDAPGERWKSGDSATGDSAWAGYRVLTDEEIDRLAEEIVEEVKTRGPFLSLADFVNRRLAEDETGRMGPLQAAIERAALNQDFIDEFPLDNSQSLPDYGHPDNIDDSTRLEQMLKPKSKAWGAPTYLTQADVLQVIGPVLSARSDTFVIRAYGDAVDAAGVVQARAWCEAVVQRTPEPVSPDESGINPKDPDSSEDFGRRFVISKFRWLRREEI